MPDKIIYGVIAGEISPDFYGRTDIQKYDLGLKKCLNFFVDYRGGAKSRGGFEYCAPRIGVTKAFRGEAIVEDYSLIFGPSYMRPMAGGGYLLEAAKTISSISETTFTASAHGYNNGDLVYVQNAVEFSQRYFRIAAATTDTFEAQLPDGASLDASGYSAYVSGGTVQRTVTLATPYTEADIPSLMVEQRRNEYYVTHINYPPAKVIRNSDTNWSYEVLTFGAGVSPPTGLSIRRSHSGAAGFSSAVTALVDGEESAASDYAVTTQSRNYTVTEGSASFTWDPVAGATEYFIYRSLVLPVGTELSRSQPLGYIGRTYGTRFTDNNITPDFTKTPPQAFNPFAASQILEIRVTSGGSGYSLNSTVTITDATGTGASAFPVVDSAGVLSSVIVRNGGQNYTAPVITVSGGSGATFTTELSPATGNFPSLFRVFQQRGIYAGTDTSPMAFWASRPRTLENFDISTVTNAGDSYSFELDAQEIRPIRHMLGLRNGLLFFTAKTISLLRGIEGREISAVNAINEPQAYKGCNNATPLAINLDVLFAQENSSAVNAMVYTEYTNAFQLQDISLLSNHLMGEGKEITRFAWYPEPHKLVWALREDGVLLSLSYERQQDVFGWAQHETQGVIKDVWVVQEQGRFVTYVAVDRFLQGRWQGYIERLQPREVAFAEDYFGADCALSIPHTEPASRLYVSGDDPQDLTLTATAGFTDAAVGDMVYFAEGKYEVTSLTSADAVQVKTLRESLNKLHSSVKWGYVEAGKWSRVTPVNELTNLWHLEGETVSVNLEGDAFLNFVVSEGKVPCPHPVTKACVGLQYVCDLETLPPVFAEFASEPLDKDIVELYLHLLNSRGVAVSGDGVDYVDMKDRTDEDYGEPLRLRSDIAAIALGKGYSKLPTAYVRQAYPLPAHILAVINRTDLEGN